MGVALATLGPAPSDMIAHCGTVSEKQHRRDRPTRAFGRKKPRGIRASLGGPGQSERVREAIVPPGARLGGLLPQQPMAGIAGHGAVTDPQIARFGAFEPVAPFAMGTGKRALRSAVKSRRAI